jgi:hypothetical protein
MFVLPPKPQIPMEATERVLARVQWAALLLQFYQRAMLERKYRQATKFLQARIQLLRDLREKRGYEA